MFFAPDGIRAFAETAVDELRRCPQRLLGLGLFWAWLQLVFVISSDTPVFQGTTFDSHNQTWMLSLLVSVATVLCIFIRSKRIDALADGRTYLLATHLTMTLGTLALAATVWLPMQKSLVLIGIALTGIGSAAAFVAWGKQLAHLALRSVLFNMAACAFIVAIVYLVATLLPLPARQAIATLLPLVSGTLLTRAPQDPLNISKPMRHQSAAEHVFSFDLMVLIVLVGFSFGMIRAMTFGHLASSMQQLTLATVVGIAIAGTLLLATAAVFKKSNHLYLVSQISLPLLAAGFLLIPLVSTAFPWPAVIFGVGHNYFYSLLWVLYVDQSRQEDRSAVAVFA
ncbi:MAG: hypothetical protein LBL27_00680, partial [Coriobacteriales bacterium]|nr:hypothetical protein [Coriobacteriales bacterium]